MKEQMQAYIASSLNDVIRLRPGCALQHMEQYRCGSFRNVGRKLTPYALWLRIHMLSQCCQHVQGVTHC